MARARLRKRRATPSESSELTLPVGSVAEVCFDDPGLVGSFYEVTITGRLVSSGCYTVAYATLVADDGAPLEETKAAADVRPRPPPEGRREFAVHESVEALHNEGWWAGVVSAVLQAVAGAPRVYQVTLPISRELVEFEETDLRPHRVLRGGRWVPAVEVGEGCPLFQEGTQVEVSGSAKCFGEYWRPASVLKVIGASNFLVKYKYIGNQRELANEILDFQYIRPAHTCRKYKFSRYSRVEVMHEASWRPGIIKEVLGNGMDKYKVKLKSYETDMDDVEPLDELTVENTQLRPQLRWDGKTWLQCLEKKSATGPTLASRKRPLFCGLSLQKEVGETSDKHGSYRIKKLKNANVVSEPMPSLSSVCSENSEINSCYPGETVKQGNAMLAPPSLPLTAGFEQAKRFWTAKQCSNQKVFTPSAPASPQSRQLEASLFGTFGQPRSLPQGPLLGMQSLNPQTPKEVIAAKSIKEARNNVSMSEGETNTANCVDPTTTLKGKGGSEHAVSEQGRGSTMGYQLSESLATNHHPFGTISSIRARIGAMEIFREMPQRPSLNQFKHYGADFCAAMALGLMLSFASLAESIYRLDVHQDHVGGAFQGKKHCLSLLEENGFDVTALGSRHSMMMMMP